MKQADIESLLQRAEAALAVAIDSSVGPRYLVGEVTTADQHVGACTCDLCMLKHEVERMRARCTAPGCGKQRYQHVGVKHMFTRKEPG